MAMQLLKGAKEAGGGEGEGEAKNVPGHVLRVPSQNDVCASSRHVSRNGDCLAAPTLCYNLRFPLHIFWLGIQKLHRQNNFI